ncbi:hypothetical protein EK21DRAFT_104677 [Setomelanomma holmii]|uniref:Uncharacterized protein n=1 Tax=Setomelanomma holmii TaxID=210430 RepID=A0A9P4LHC1_9PLEO|nr:hypothetical protein EK21DRAFT_104677 [Setomelanomma holmii]
MCVSAIATPLPVHALITTTYTNGASSSYYDYVVNDQSTVSNMTTMTQGTAVADPLYVAWEASDLSLFPVAYATSLAQKVGVAFTPTATPSPGTTDSNSSGLSSGAKIGIGVGAGVGGFLLIALVAMGFIIRRLRRRNQAVTTYPNEATPELGGTEAGAVKEKWYHGARPAEQAQGNNGVNELDSIPVQYLPGPPVELEGSHVQGTRY